MAKLVRWYLVVGLAGTASAPTWGQAGRPIVTGRVLDGQAQPVPGATVRLLHLPDSTTTAGTQADATGRYELAATPGRYALRASAVGFRPATLSLTLRSEDARLTIPDLRLTADAQQLREVTVTGQPPAVEVSAGKTVYNLAQRTSAAGTTAFDVLQRTPGISVTQDDNLQLKGNPNVTVLLDGKRTYLSGPQLATLLRGLPAENLARLEVLTTPGAAYDAAGSAGLINLVTKKSTRPGYALDLGAGAGTGRYPQTTETLTGNVKTARYNLYGNYSYTYKKSYLDRTSYRVLDAGPGPTTYDRASFDPSVSSGHTYRLGLDLTPGPRQTLGILYSGYRNLWTRTGTGPTRVSPAAGPAFVVQNTNVTREPGANDAINLTYKLALDTAGRQFTADADYARYRSSSDGALGTQLRTPEGQPLAPYQELRFSQPNETTIRAGRVDLSWPLGKLKLAAGGKYSYVTSDNDFLYDSLQANGSYTEARTLSNYFVYDEHIAALYATAGRALGKMQLDLGLRLESTRSTGRLLDRGLENRRAYTNLFPSLQASRPLGERHRLSVALGRRINRPLYGDLNPARYFFDKYSYYVGNPFLQPETAWNAAATYTYRDDYSLTVSASRTSQAISSFASQNSATGELAVSIANAAYRDELSAQFVVPLKPTRWWSVQNSLLVLYARADYGLAGGIAFAPRRVNVDFSTTHTLQLPAALRLEVAAYYTSPSLAGVYLYRTWFTVDAGLRRSWLAGRLDVRLAGTDLLNTIHYWGYSLYAGANTSYNHVGDNRRVNLSATYHLGGTLTTRAARTVEEAGRVK